MTTHFEPGNNMRDPAALGQFTLGNDTLYRCVCSTEPARLHLADVRGRIVADPTWDQHRTITCSGCGRYGRLDPTDPDRGAVAVLGVAPLPASCDECGAERGEACRYPFCPGQDLLDLDPTVDPPAYDECDAGGEDAALTYTAAELIAELPSTTLIWRYWASRALHPCSGHSRSGALRSTAQATAEVWRLRRELRHGPAQIVSTAQVDHSDVAELLEYLAGHGSTADQHRALFTLRISQGWGDSVALDLVDAAAVWQGPDPF
ncbi:hypothetical protein FRP1_28795 (plasmid) [Pseudonocardia sp. EC080625-04]|uniref:hypothetical protein n=1 Tax=Pseudonocardia sp. EC080625-04 TaxID=1096868 RepID=UPI0006CB3A25|nr:hypothetical protein [Pseudonocardia sp. EC080625-04]ALE76796.1 hypothetical protein FRP1_28795 [Pseudonocardia sp. EC080625-04]